MVHFGQDDGTEPGTEPGTESMLGNEPNSGKKKEKGLGALRKAVCYGGQWVLQPLWYQSLGVPRAEERMS